MEYVYDKLGFFFHNVIKKNNPSQFNENVYFRCTLYHSHLKMIDLMGRKYAQNLL